MQCFFPRTVDTNKVLLGLHLIGNKALLCYVRIDLGLCNQCSYQRLRGQKSLSVSPETGRRNRHLNVNCAIITESLA